MEAKEVQARVRADQAEADEIPIRQVELRAARDTARAEDVERERGGKVERDR